MADAPCGGLAREPAPLRDPVAQYILFYMKRILIELDERCARDLERVAPAKKRMRAEFVRLAIRQAIDRALDRATEKAYRERPLASEPGDLLGWDEGNELAQPSSGTKRARRRRGTKSAA